ncbi:PREDICTED: 52 kDa repressor of the inhibitor of the protein kinase-like [Wasmannia auropunctata]|uniref:52 kDa repressor of the inhibitor of the protein kinase-like n=1 Tax=Wasmannia auropunctata TaxID=64793 RepID=UPI0005EFE213|nr:PREDICTED: 52 kDa repressor of the inhibitor of the protein kinase-like [Wasmannia auropunctata]
MDKCWKGCNNSSNNHNSRNNSCNNRSCKRHSRYQMYFIEDKGVEGATPAGTIIKVAEAAVEVAVEAAVEDAVEEIEEVVYCCIRPRKRRNLENMSGKKQPSCAVPLCIQSHNVEGRFFFRFPREHDRWLQWIRACGRLDLESKGPEYAYQNYRLCHLHFEKKWYKINKIKARLHPDAIPTLFGLNLGQDDADTVNDVNDDIIQPIEVQEDTSNADNSNMILPIDNIAEVARPRLNVNKSSDDSPRKRKLRLKIKKLKA